MSPNTPLSFQWEDTFSLEWIWFMQWALHRRDGESKSSKISKMNPCTGVMDQITNETIDVIAELTAEVSPSPKVVSQNCMADDYLSEDQDGVYKPVSHREWCTFILYHEDLRRGYLHKVKEIQQPPGRGGEIPSLGWGSVGLGWVVWKVLFLSH